MNRGHRRDRQVQYGIIIIIIRTKYCTNVRNAKHPGLPSCRCLSPTIPNPLQSRAMSQNCGECWKDAADAAFFRKKEIREGSLRRDARAIIIIIESVKAYVSETS